jgi:hypothetical protein
LPETTALPLANEHLSRDMCGSRAMRKIVFVKSLVPVGLIPNIATPTMAAAGNERSFKPVDGPAMF